MRARKLQVGAAIVLVTAGIGVTGASPASAADVVSITTDCNSNVGLRANVGDTVVITMSADCVDGFGVVWNINALGVDATASGFFGPAAVENSPETAASSQFTGDWYAYSNGAGTTTITTTLRSENGAGDPLAVGSYLANIGFNSTGPYGIFYLGARSGASPIPAWVQAYGRDKDGTCEDGWDASWQSWAEPVTGGWVCTRSIPSLG